MTGLAFALVCVVVAAQLGVVVALLLDNRGMRADLRRVTNRLLSALVADDARELATLNRIDAAAEPGAADFMERERTAAKVMRDLERANGVAEQPRGVPVGMQ